jgi:hypothetical protein
MISAGSSAVGRARDVVWASRLIVALLLPVPSARCLLFCCLGMLLARYRAGKFSAILRLWRCGRLRLSSGLPRPAL